MIHAVWEEDRCRGARLAHPGVCYKSATRRRAWLYHATRSASSPRTRFKSERKKTAVALGPRFCRDSTLCCRHLSLPHPQNRTENKIVLKRDHSGRNSPLTHVKRPIDPSAQNTKARCTLPRYTQGLSKARRKNEVGRCVRC